MAQNPRQSRRLLHVPLGKMKRTRTWSLNQTVVQGDGGEDIYIFMKVFFKTNLFIWFHIFQTQQPKSYSWFIFPMFDSNLIQNDFLYGYEWSITFYLSSSIQPSLKIIFTDGSYATFTTGWGARRVPGAHGKAQIAHSEGFVLCCSRQRTHGKRSHDEPYLYSRPNCGHTVKHCRKSTLTHGKIKVTDGGIRRGAAWRQGLPCVAHGKTFAVG